MISACSGAGAYNVLIYPEWIVNLFSDYTIILTEKVLIYPEWIVNLYCGQKLEITEEVLIYPEWIVNF